MNSYRTIVGARRGFTLVEIMIVVAIIGMLAALAVPTFITARKQSQAKRIYNDARQIDAAISQWALEYGKKDGDDVDLDQVASYMKTGVVPTKDILGNDYENISTVNPVQVQVSDTTKDALSGINFDWNPY